MAIELPKLKQILEAALFAGGEPLSLDKLKTLFPEDDLPSDGDFAAALAGIETDYADRGVQLRKVASGYRFQARQDVGEWVTRLWEEKPQRYSRALLETLALIAYRQPITRGEVEAIRGVSVNSQIIKTLQEREWIRIVGYRDVPGRPAMFGTTRDFLDYFNLARLEDLPTLAEIRDLEDLSPELDLKAPPAADSTAGSDASLAPQPELPLEAAETSPGSDPSLPAEPATPVQD
jgi:segregation and condensation protein B